MKTSLACATESLRHYGLENAALMQLGGISRSNFKVEIDDRSYVLHLYTNGEVDRAEIASELVWLNSLQKDTSLVLPQPIANLAGELVTGVSIDNEAETLCTIVAWVEGKIPPTVDAMSEEQLSEAGTLMAQLHLHSQQFELPLGFTRPIYNEAYFMQRSEGLCAVLDNSELDKNDLKTLRESADKIITRFAQLERKPDRFGMIHGDFHSGNYLIWNDKVRIIDFDRCGFGFHLFDLALALMELQEHQRQPFLQGYETAKPLPPDYSDLKLLFLCLAYLDNLGLLSTNPEELPFIVEELHFAALQAFRDAIERL